MAAPVSCDVASWRPASLVGILLCLNVPAAAQDAPPKTDTPSEFFSGIVAELEAEKITVSRTVLGKRAERRTFRINTETRIEGKLSAKARVTVRFSALEEGDLAIQILVRPAKK